MQRFLRRPLGAGEAPSGIESRIRRVEDYLGQISAALAKLTNDTQNPEITSTPIPPAGVEMLDDLDDADINSPVTGQILVYNGTDFTNDDNTPLAFGFGQTVPTARVHLGAGTTSASSAPLKLTSGTNMSAVENGSFEYDGTELYFSRSSARLKVLLDTPVDGTNLTLGTTLGMKFGTGSTQKIGFWGATPVVRGAAYTVTNSTPDRVYDTAATTLNELAQVVAALIADLQSVGLIG